MAVTHTSLNYEDALCLTGQSGLVRRYPHVPGIDFAAIVERSHDPRYAESDGVILTGWRVGELTRGGFAERAQVKGEWLVPRPAGLSAMLVVSALRAHNVAAR